MGGIPSYLLGFIEQCFLHLGHFFGLVPKVPSPLPLKCLDTHQRILFRVSLYKFICKETWYRAPNISTVAKYQKTVRNLYVSDSYSLRKKKYLTRTGCKDLRKILRECLLNRGAISAMVLTIALQRSDAICIIRFFYTIMSKPTR